MDLSKFIIFDIETIGLQKETGQIIEIAALQVENWQITAEFDRLIDPGIKVPRITRDLTGITDQDLAGQPDISVVAKEFLAFIGDQPLVGHNVVSFDRPFFDHNLQQLGLPVMANPILDTMELSIFLKPRLKKYKLEFLYNAVLNRKVEQTHRAAGDCRQVFELLLGLKKVRDQEWDKNWLDHVGAIAQKENWPWADFILASEAMSLGPKIESYLPVENYLKDLSPFRQTPADIDLPVRQIDSDLVKYYFAKDQAHLKDVLGAQKYEYRPQQGVMAQRIAEAINQDKILAIEAPTGCGKSLAYLLPGLVWSLENNNRPVVVSTYTNALQDQLGENDFALLNKIFPLARLTVVKGREHYVCLRKLKNFFDDNAAETLFWANSRYSTRLASLFIANWVIKNAANNGDFDGFSSWFKNQLRDFDKSDICSDADSCQRRFCKYYKKCFLNRLRESAQQSNVVITNHALLFADAWDQALMPSLLPKNFSTLIMDEAINLEDAATDASTLEFSKNNFSRKLNDFFNRQRPGKDLAGSLKLLLEKKNDQADLQSLYAQIAVVEKMGEESELLFDVMRQEVKASRLKYDWRQEIQPPFVQQLRPQLENINAGLIGLSGFIYHVIQKHFEEEKDDFYQRLKNYQDSLLQYSLMIGVLFDLNKEKYIFYRTIRSDLQEFSLNACYRRIGDFLQGKLFHNPNLKSLILTSATLTYNQNFDFINRVWGLDRLDQTRLDYLRLDYLFNFDKQCRLFLVKDLPRKNYEFPAENAKFYYPQTADFIKSVLLANGGSSLVLFTNREDVEKFSQRLIDDLEENNIPLYSSVRCNDYRIFSASLATVAQEFRENVESCLLGTAGLREGIDVPGPSLEIVILVKMPFAIPSDPVTANRRAVYGDFDGYTLPHCIFDLKQAFGRLIRTKTDQGFVFLLDEKVDKHFRTLANNLPPALGICHLSKNDLPDLCAIIKKTKKEKNRVKKVAKFLADARIEPPQNW
jgi:ATP-dependent DNA helicase DinG